MRMIAIDDDPFTLGELIYTIQKAYPAGELQGFSSPYEALLYAETIIIHVAFLNIELDSVNGITLAEKLKDIQPDIHIIFVTSHECFAVDAFRIHAAGYLLKPVLPKDISRELAFLYSHPIHEKNCRVRGQTFGGFEIFVDGQPIFFKRAKAKELLACLIDRNGASISISEACAILWEDDCRDVKKNYLRTLIKDLKDGLKAVGVQDILIRRRNSLAINPSLIDCDLYRFMKGDPVAVNSYRHDYMPCFSWAEFSIGALEQLRD